MSAYGAIVSSTVSRSALPSTIWSARRSRPNPGAAEAPSSNPPYLTLHHLTLSRAAALPGLIAYLHTVFAQFIEEGATYPQETAPGEMYQQQAFETYFFAGDVIVGIAGSGAGDQASQLAVEPNGPGEVKEINVDIDAARAGRTWEECVAGFYYVKPNYPGRSSHICNGGFVVPASQSGKGYGTVLARSYLHYAPKLGYQASVFNLVYVNNHASVKLWEGLNFVKAGRIPRAGRLRRKDGDGEEYVDAWVFYKDFTQP